MRINMRLEAAHKIIMEISLLIMEKSWNNHGILILNFCGNPGINTYGAEIHKVRKHAIHAFPLFLFLILLFRLYVKEPF